MVHLKVNTFVEIEEMGRSGKVRFYTLRIDEAPRTEAERFRMRFLDHPLHGSDYLEIASILKQIAKRGAQRRYFRHERLAEALPPKFIRNSKLRQYVIRISDNILILGNGCVKETRTAQESQDCKPTFRIMNKVSERITNLCIERDILVSEDCLEGELNFELDL